MNSGAPQQPIVILGEGQCVDLDWTVIGSFKLMWADLACPQAPLVCALGWKSAHGAQSNR